MRTHPHIPISVGIFIDIQHYQEVPLTLTIPTDPEVNPNVNTVLNLTLKTLLNPQKLQVNPKWHYFINVAPL